MDQAERTKYKRLANDAIVDLFGSESREAQLATALEQCVADLEYHDNCNGPQPEPEAAIVNLDTLQAIHEQLKERLEEIENAASGLDERLDDLREAVKDFKNDVKELGEKL